MKSIGEILKQLTNIKSKEEAHLYLIEELKNNQDAWSNIKYITGYLGNEERNRILNLFK